MPADLERERHARKTTVLRHLDAKPVQQWTDDEAAAHLKFMFDDACATHPGIMEGYMAMLVDATDDAQRREIMRTGLRETTELRYPALLSPR